MRTGEGFKGPFPLFLTIMFVVLNQKGLILALTRKSHIKLKIKMDKEREDYLLSLFPADEGTMREKHFHQFEKHARYMGNGVYCIGSIWSSDVRELWLLFVLASENILVEEEEEEEDF